VKLFVACALVALTGVAPAAGPQLDMVGFFTGRTHSDNVMKVVFHRSSGLVVDSVGRMEGKQFVLIDTVHEQGKPARIRKWLMHPSGPGRFTGTLSDAEGPVTIAASGPSATIRYVMNGGLNVNQQLQLLPDGKTLSNHVVVRKFGLKFGTVDGKIHKLD
jgi:hypothetical protein